MGATLIFELRWLCSVFAVLNFLKKCLFILLPYPKSYRKFGTFVVCISKRRRRECQKCLHFESPADYMNDDAGYFCLDLVSSSSSGGFLRSRSNPAAFAPRTSASPRCRKNCGVPPQNSWFRPVGARTSWILTWTKISVRWLRRK